MIDSRIDDYLADIEDAEAALPVMTVDEIIEASYRNRLEQLALTAARAEAQRQAYEAFERETMAFLEAMEW